MEANYNYRSTVNIHRLLSNCIRHIVLDTGAGTQREHLRKLLKLLSPVFKKYLCKLR